MVLGLAAFNIQVIQGALYQLLNFSLISGGLYLMISMLHPRTGTTVACSLVVPEVIYLHPGKTIGSGHNEHQNPRYRCLSRGDPADYSSQQRKLAAFPAQLKLVDRLLRPIQYVPLSRRLDGTALTGFYLVLEESTCP